MLLSRGLRERGLKFAPEPYHTDRNDEKRTIALCF